MCINSQGSLIERSLNVWNQRFFLRLCASDVECGEACSFSAQDSSVSLPNFAGSSRVIGSRGAPRWVTTAISEIFVAISRKREKIWPRLLLLTINKFIQVVDLYQHRWPWTNDGTQRDNISIFYTLYRIFRACCSDKNKDKLTRSVARKIAHVHRFQRRKECSYSKRSRWTRALNTAHVKER